MSPNIETYKEKNIDLTAFLKACGIPVVEVDTTDPQNLVWHFAQPKKCEELIQQFYQGTAQVNPQRILLEAKRLKDEIFTLRRQRNGGNRNDRNRSY